MRKNEMFNEIVEAGHVEKQIIIILLLLLFYIPDSEND